MGRLICKRCAKHEFLTAAKVKKQRIFVGIIGVCSGFSAGGKSKVFLKAYSMAVTAEKSEKLQKEIGPR
jgi:hypothetical protein